MSKYHASERKKEICIQTPLSATCMPTVIELPNRRDCEFCEQLQIILICSPCPYSYSSAIPARPNIGISVEVTFKFKKIFQNQNFHIFEGNKVYALICTEKDGCKHMHTHKQERHARTHGCLHALNTFINIATSILALGNLLSLLNLEIFTKNIPVGWSTSTFVKMPNLLNHFSSLDHESSKPVILL